MANADTLGVIDYRLRVALEGLRRARDAANHSLNSHTLRGEQIAEDWLNQLLEQRADLTVRMEEEDELRTHPARSC